MSPDTKVKIEYRTVRTISLKNLNKLGEDGWRPHNLENHSLINFTGLLFREVLVGGFQKE